jgi:DNA-binding transcriptional regulator GbsR (MarR family)
MVETSKENGERKIYFYKTIDAAEMKKDFFEKISQFKNHNN